jgi:hypothetical protein
MLLVKVVPPRGRYSFILERRGKAEMRFFVKIYSLSTVFAVGHSLEQLSDSGIDTIHDTV